MVNLTCSEGKLPTILKMVKMISAYKKGCKTEVTNHRTMSLLSSIGKIIEKSLK